MAESVIWELWEVSLPVRCVISRGKADALGWFPALEAQGPWGQFLSVNMHPVFSVVGADPQRPIPFSSLPPSSESLGVMGPQPEEGDDAQRHSPRDSFMTKTSQQNSAPWVELLWDSSKSPFALVAFIFVLFPPYMCPSLSYTSCHWESWVNWKYLSFALTHIIVNMFKILPLDRYFWNRLSCPYQDAHHSRAFREREQTCIKWQIDATHEATPLHFCLPLGSRGGCHCHHSRGKYTNSGKSHKWWKAEARIKPESMWFSSSSSVLSNACCDPRKAWEIEVFWGQGGSHLWKVFGFF